MDTSTLFISLFFGSAGFGYLIYGKKQKSIVPAVSGVMLMVFPYFVSNAYLLVATGVALMAIPFFVRR